MSEAATQKKESETKRVRGLVERALGTADVRADAGDAAFALDAEDGRYTIALQRVVYVKRFARESRVGFGAVA